MFNEEASRRVVDQRVQRVRVKGKRVVVVKTVDVHFRHVDLVVGVDGGGVEEVTRARRDQV